jgi:hypothetical protein
MRPMTEVETMTLANREFLDSLNHWRAHASREPLALAIDVDAAVEALTADMAARSGLAGTPRMGVQVMGRRQQASKEDRP